VRSGDMLVQQCACEALGNLARFTAFPPFLVTVSPNRVAPPSRLFIGSRSHFFSGIFRQWQEESLQSSHNGQGGSAAPTLIYRPTPTAVDVVHGSACTRSPVPIVAIRPLCHTPFSFVFLQIGNPSSCLSFLQGLVEAVVACLNAHPDHGSLVVGALQCLSVLCLEEHEDRLIEARGVSVLLKATKLPE
jgi:hypothetical protein